MRTAVFYLGVLLIGAGGFWAGSRWQQRQWQRFIIISSTTSGQLPEGKPGDLLRFDGKEWKKLDWSQIDCGGPLDTKGKKVMVLHDQTMRFSPNNQPAERVVIQRPSAPRKDKE